MCASAPPSTASGITAKSKQSFKGELLAETASGMVEGSILALSVFAAQIHLSQRERLWQYGKVLGFAKGSPLGRAVERMRD